MSPIVVTGAASGIGAATSLRLRQTGVDVIGVDRNQHAGVDVVADLSTPAGISAVVDAVPSELGGLCNCAGVPGTAAPATVMSVNTVATLTLAEELGSRLSAGAAVVSLASIAGGGWRERVPVIREYLARAKTGDHESWFAEQPELVSNAYDFSKQCLIYGSQMLAAQRIASEVRYLTVSPGPVATPILKDFRESLGHTRVDASIALVGGAASPESIADVVVFAMSPEARWLNGTDVVVDGGLSAARLYGSNPEPEVQPAQ